MSKDLPMSRPRRSPISPITDYRLLVRAPFPAMTAFPAIGYWLFHLCTVVLAPCRKPKESIFCPASTKRWNQ